MPVTDLRGASSAYHYLLKPQSRQRQKMNKNILKLSVRWNKKEQDFEISYPRKCDGSFMHSAFMSKRTFQSKVEYSDPNYKKFGDTYEWDVFKDLDARGYDLTTFKLEITIKKSELAKRFPHLLDMLTDEEKADLKSQGFSIEEEKQEDDSKDHLGENI